MCICCTRIGSVSSKQEVALAALVSYINSSDSLFYVILVRYLFPVFLHDLVNQLN